MTGRMGCWSRRARVTASLALLVVSSSLGAQASSTDWANLARYRSANAELAPPAPGEQRVVFIGNSITDSWAKFFPQMFPGKPYIGRGISGQTTPQMLVRFRQDVIALKPAVVVILAGTNDIAGNTGPSTLEMIEDNLGSMTELAKASGIRVVLSSVLPVYDYPWKKGLEPAPKIIALNAWIKAYAARVGATYLDYHTAMKDDRQGLRADLTSDGVHPTEAGYRVMAPLAEQAVAEALRGVARQQSSPAVVVPAERLRTLGDSLTPGASRTAQLGGGPGYTYAVTHRDSTGGVEAHDAWTDMFVVQSGSATVITGGSLDGAREATPGEWRGGTIRGGHEARVRPGDVVTIPAGTPHQMVLASGEKITYLAFKIAKPTSHP